jgi:hypothetical protein
MDYPQVFGGSSVSALIVMYSRVCAATKKSTGLSPKNIAPLHKGKKNVAHIL